MLRKLADYARYLDVRGHHEEADQITAILRTAKRFDETGQGELFSAHDLEGLDFAIERNPYNPDSYKLHALMRGRTIGYLRFNISPKKEAWIGMVQVEPEFQGTGVGEALYEQFQMVLHQEHPDVRLVKGYAYGPQGYQTRRKVFGPALNIEPGELDEDQEIAYYDGPTPITHEMATDYLSQADKDHPWRDPYNLLVTHAGPAMKRDQMEAMRTAAKSVYENMDGCELMYAIKTPDYEIRMEKVAVGDNTVPIASAYTLHGDYVGNPDDARFFILEKGIHPEKADPGHSVCSIGFCPKERKWYGWSHRALQGFGVGEEIDDEDHCCCSAQPGKALPVGFKAQNLDDAKQMAIAFADSVS